ncbi:MAG: hypothetical protein M3T55_08260 [Pseudomonadota bacterium]|nr:hypothetical protein [Pseudomonadota bacterium]
MKRTAPDPRAQAKRSALNALRRAKRAADRAGVDLSSWEGEFLGSVEERLNTYGRAFGDPEKGAAGAALSILQGVKLKEISAKARGEPRFANKSPGTFGNRPRRG